MVGIITERIETNRRLEAMGVDGIPPDKSQIVMQWATDSEGAVAAALGSAALVAMAAIALTIIVSYIRRAIRPQRRSPYDPPGEGIIIGTSLHVLLIVFVAVALQNVSFSRFVNAVPRDFDIIAAPVFGLMLIFINGYVWTKLVLIASRWFGYKGDGSFS